MFKTTVLCGTVLVALISGGGTAFGATPLSDPTRPPAAVAAPATGASAPHWRISSILYSHQRRVAVVNGRLASEGDVVDGARVVAIDADAVVLRRGERRFSVPLQSEIVKSSQGVRKTKGNRHHDP